MTQHRVPSCGRHLGKLDDVTIYPVLVVARTDELESVQRRKEGTIRILKLSDKYFPLSSFKAANGTLYKMLSGIITSSGLSRRSATGAMIML